MSEPTLHDMHTRIPEEMSVGLLNNTVRALREWLYQARLREQALRAQRDALVEALRSARSVLMLAYGRSADAIRERSACIDRLDAALSLVSPESGREEKR